jgi:hypothetical protein
MLHHNPQCCARHSPENLVSTHIFSIGPATVQRTSFEPTLFLLAQSTVQRTSFEPTFFLLAQTDCTPSKKVDVPLELLCGQAAQCQGLARLQLLTRLWSIRQACLCACGVFVLLGNNVWFKSDFSTDKSPSFNALIPYQVSKSRIVIS